MTTHITLTESTDARNARLAAAARINAAHADNIAAAHREIQSRAAEGEDMRTAFVCPRTYAIYKREHLVVTKGGTRSVFKDVAGAMAYIQSLVEQTIPFTYSVE